MSLNFNVSFGLSDFEDDYFLQDLQHDIIDVNEKLTVNNIDIVNLIIIILMIYQKIFLIYQKI
jgi:hypothetical protein